MCGLFGWHFRPSVTLEQRCIVAAVLACHMDDRGGDSWGFYDPAVDKIRRGLGEISRGVKARDLASHDCLLGHTRRATTGKITRRNSHPFRCGQIVGAHNGMVSNHEELNEVYRRDCSVDSQQIFRHLDEGQDLREIEAYGAVEFAYTTHPDRVYLGRFHEGDLHVWGGRWGVVWASTRTSIRQALKLAVLKAVPYEINEGPLYVVHNGELLLTTQTLNFSPFVSRYASNFDFRRLTSEPLFGPPGDAHVDLNEWDIPVD